VSSADLVVELGAEPRKHACKRVASKYPNCCCERGSVVPELSPGAVQDGELLIRFVNPQYYDLSKNEVKPSLFDHASAAGMSIVRAEHADRDAIKAKQSSGGYVGYVTAACGEIRKLVEGGSRMFCIYDTALPIETYHADVCQAVFGEPPKKSIAVERRIQLMRLFTKTPIDARVEPTIDPKT
jgi:hypothetical protein